MLWADSPLSFSFPISVLPCLVGTNPVPLYQWRGAASIYSVSLYPRDFTYIGPFGFHIPTKHTIIVRCLWVKKLRPRLANQFNQGQITNEC